MSTGTSVLIRSIIQRAKNTQKKVFSTFHRFPSFLENNLTSARVREMEIILGNHKKSYSRCVTTVILLCLFHIEYIAMIVKSMVQLIELTIKIGTCLSAGFPLYRVKGIVFCSDAILRFTCLSIAFCRSDRYKTMATNKIAKNSNGLTKVVRDT